MAITNGSFETDTVSDPGVPDSWTLSITATAEEFAGFEDGSGLTRDVPSEKFEGGWSSNESFSFTFAFPIDLSELEQLFFDLAQPNPETVEDYEEGWFSGIFLYEWGPSEAAAFDSSTPETVEDFEEEWLSNESFAFTLGSTTSASFDSSTPEAVEDFEEEWLSNESFDFSMGSVTLAAFDAAAETVEDFEEINVEQVFTANTGSDLVVAPSHGMSTDDAIEFRNVGGALPTGIVSDTVYYVRVIDANNFRIRLDTGGPDLPIDSDGTGIHYFISTGLNYWIEMMTTI